MFNRVAVHLLTQRKRSMKRGPNKGVPQCLYRTKDGLKCAIGCLIPDSKYDKEFEGKSIHARAVRHAAGITDDNVWLAGQLQAVHDNRLPADWWRDLNALAQQFRLNTNAIKHLEPK